jgi:hypothetical protein
VKDVLETEDICLCLFNSCRTRKRCFCLRFCQSCKNVLEVWCMADSVQRFLCDLGNIALQKYYHWRFVFLIMEKLENDAFVCGFVIVVCQSCKKFWKSGYGSMKWFVCDLGHITLPKYYHSRFVLQILNFTRTVYTALKNWPVFQTIETPRQHKCYLWTGWGTKWFFAFWVYTTVQTRLDRSDASPWLGDWAVADSKNRNDLYHTDQ